MGIDRDEFLQAVAWIREDVRGVHDRLDLLNGRTRANEIAIATLEERHKTQTRKTATWAGSVGIFVAALAEGIHWVITK